MRAQIPLACLLAVAALHADPLKSAACGEALQQLDAARGSAGAEALRQRAVRTCLGGGTLPPQRAQRWSDPPLTVPAPVTAPPGQAAAALVPQAPPGPLRIERPASLTACDANGCWAADGARLQHLAPVQIGPGGLCAAQGGFVFCP